MNIYDLISRAQKLRKETQLDSVSPDRVGGLQEDTLKYINEFQLLASSPSLHKIYASVSAMQSDKSPKSDLTGKLLKPGQLVVIVPANQTDATAGDVYRYDGPSGNTSAWTFVAKIGAVPADAELSATSTNPPQNKVVTEKLTELESEEKHIKTNTIGILIAEEGKGITTSGNVASWATSCIFNPILLRKGETIQVTSLTFGQCVISKLNDDGGYSPLVNAVDAKPSTSQVYVYTANEDIEVVCSGTTIDTTAVVVSDKSLVEKVSVLQSELKENTGKITRLSLGEFKVADSSYIIDSLDSFEQGTLDGKGAPKEGDGRFRSAEYHLLPMLGTKVADIRIIKSSTISYYVYWYNESKSFISYSNLYEENDSIIEPPTNARYCKLIVAHVPDVGAFTLERLMMESISVRVAHTDTKELLEKSNNANILSVNSMRLPSFNLLSYGWKMGSYYDKISDNTSRRYKVIKVSLGERYLIHKPSSEWGGYIYYADENGVIGYDAIQDNMEILVGVKNGRIPSELRITITHSPEAILNETIWESFDIKLLNQSSKVLSKPRVATWNWGMLNNGVGPIGIVDDEVDVYLPKIKELITSLDADILVATEYASKLDRSKTRDTYDAVLKQFYPYKLLTRDNWTAIFSKFPFEVELVASPDNRDFLLGYLNINGSIVGFGAIHPRSASGTEAEDARIADHQMVIDYFANYDKAIVVGDFNTYEDRELDVYRNAGWNLGNCGYFGNIDTYMPSSRPWYIDNIVTKGININNFVKVDNRADVSDHYPVVANLSFL